MLGGYSGNWRLGHETIFLIRSAAPNPAPDKAPASRRPTGLQGSNPAVST